MKIHDTEKLRKRADSHAKEDHIKQGTYGHAETNGYTEYKGCAVSCLATPSLDEGLVNWIKLKGAMRVEKDGTDVWKVGGILPGPFMSARLRETVEDQFGINTTLMIIAEGLFEAQPTHGAAIEFVKEFAHSFKEGTDITEQMAYDWGFAVTGRDLNTWERVGFVLHQQAATDDREAPSYKRACKKMTKEFLKFCKDPKKIPVV